MKKMIAKIIITGIILILLAYTGFTVYNYTSSPSAPDGGYIHMSFDDTISLFEDITNNQDRYESVFDNEMLAYCKELHEEYGAVFSFYCFYQNDDFNLLNCTHKFQQDFKDNADWLKFGFHNMSDQGNLANSTLSEATEYYTTVTKQLIEITGSEDCIDTVIRLQNFAGSSEAVDGLLSSETRIKGLLTADDDRISYFLDDNDSRYISEHDDYFEQSKKIYLVSTDLRLENSVVPYNDLTAICKDANQNKIIEVFTHEWKYNAITKSKMKTVCEFAKKAGYEWKYPMDNIVYE